MRVDYDCCKYVTLSQRFSLINVMSSSPGVMISGNYTPKDMNVIDILESWNLLKVRRSPNVGAISYRLLPTEFLWF